jgi:3-oxoadipate enol-lactonase
MSPDRSAPYLNLQHGYCRTLRFWYQWVPYLSGFYKVVRPDLRGLGQSDRRYDLATELNAEEYIEDVRAIVAHIGDGRSTTAANRSAARPRWHSPASIRRWCVR